MSCTLPWTAPRSEWHSHTCSQP